MGGFTRARRSGEKLGLSLPGTCAEVVPVGWAARLACCVDCQGVQSRGIVKGLPAVVAAQPHHIPSHEGVPPETNDHPPWCVSVELTGCVSPLCAAAAAAAGVGPRNHTEMVQVYLLPHLSASEAGRISGGCCPVNHKASELASSAC